MNTSSSIAVMKVVELEKTRINFHYIQELSQLWVRVRTKQKDSKHEGEANGQCELNSRIEGSHSKEDSNKPSPPPVIMTTVRRTWEVNRYYWFNSKGGDNHALTDQRPNYRSNNLLPAIEGNKWL